MNENRTANVEVHNAPPHDHAVHVYADRRAIEREIIRFVEEGLTLGEGVVIAATAEHREKIAAWCSGNVSARDRESLVVLDAVDALKNFMVAGMPDPALFGAFVDPLLKHSSRDGRRLRLFGEMVALLWSDGNVTGALALESLWNDMAAKHQFFLLCAYPGVLLDEAPLGAVNAMCDRHSDLSLLGYVTEFAEATPATRFRAERLLLPVSTAGSAAREAAVWTLYDWQLPHLTEKCLIIVSEFVTNAVRHAESCFRLTLSREASSLRIAIEDAAGHLPAMSRIESIASAWGRDVTPDGKSVWAELPL